MYLWITLKNILRYYYNLNIVGI